MDTSVSSRGRGTYNHTVRSSIYTPLQSRKVRWQKLCGKRCFTKRVLESFNELFYLALKVCLVGFKNDEMPSGYDIFRFLIGNAADLLLPLITFFSTH